MYETGVEFEGTVDPNSGDCPACLVTVAGDRTSIGSMAFSFARVGAVVGMKVEVHYQTGKR